MNLIVTCARHFEPETTEELEKILGELGDDEPEIITTGMSGILTVKTIIDANQVTEKLKAKIDDEPWSIRYILRVIPIERVSKTDVTEIKNNALDLSQKIADDESYRITIEKRNSEISSKELISSIADNIDRKVSLDNPDWVLLIEVLGPNSGISVIKEENILSVEKAKRSISE